MTDRELESLSADPALGLRLRNALTYYADDQKAARLVFVYSLLARVPARYDGALTDEKRVLLDAHRISLIQELVTKLREGALFARGFLPNSLQLLTIPAEWWTSVRLDLQTSAAEAHGTRIQGILIFEVPELSKGSEAILDPAAVRSVVSEAFARAEAWVAENYKPGWKRAQTIIQCRAAANVTERVARAAWNAQKDDRRGTRGRRKGN